MAQLLKIITQIEKHIENINEEVYNRENKASDQIDKWEGWEDSEKGRYYVDKTEALDELVNLLFEAQEKAEKIKSGDFI